MNTYITFLKAHEKLIGIVLLVLFAFWGFNKAITAYDGHLQRQDEAAVLAEQNRLKLAQEQNQQIVTQLATLQQQVAQSNLQLAAQIASLHTQTVKQQQVDAKMTLPQLAVRQAQLVNVKPEEFTVTTNGITESPLAAISTVQQLETIPELQTTIQSKDQVIKNDEAVITKQQDVIASDKTVLVAEQSSHQADVKALKDSIAIEKKKSFWKGIKYGAGITLGAVTTVAVLVFVH